MLQNRGIIPGTFIPGFLHQLPDLPYHVKPLAYVGIGAEAQVWDLADVQGGAKPGADKTGRTWENALVRDTALWGNPKREWLVNSG